MNDVSEHDDRKSQEGDRNSMLWPGDELRMSATHETLRVAFLAGTLGQGGAEKQLTYMARSLMRLGVDVRVCSLTRGEYFEPALQAAGVPVVWVGESHNPALRLLTLRRALNGFRPHVLQAAHFYTNLYVVLLSRLLGCLAIGSIRNDAIHEMQANRFWGRSLLRLPPTLLANSFCAKGNAQTMDMDPRRVFVLPNVIDVAAFDAAAARVPCGLPADGRPLALAVARLVPAKRLERFIAALSIARDRGSCLRGAIVGEGAERGRLEALARAHNLACDALRFLGRRDDVPALLRRADMLVLTSEHEGFPNVLLEAMAARLPVVTTPAGDASLVVENGITGYVVPPDDTEALAARLMELAVHRRLGIQMGSAGRRRLEERFSAEALSDRLLSVYKDIATARHDRALLEVLAS